MKNMIFAVGILVSTMAATPAFAGVSNDADAIVVQARACLAYGDEADAVIKGVSADYTDLNDRIVMLKRCMVTGLGHMDGKAKAAGLDLADLGSVDDNENIKDAVLNTKICRQATLATMSGDENWLENFFNKPPVTPPSLRLVTMQYCIAYNEGFIAGFRGQ